MKSIPFETQKQDFFYEPKEARNRRMQWFREARFGMFVHWGLYAIPAGEWKGKTYSGAGEWLMYHAQIPPEEYEPLQKQFNPIKFEAREWVRIAKNAGMKYLVITSKHHDGFCLFDSKYTNYDIMGTPFKRDVIKELSQACKENGILFCVYYSIMDWHHPDYLPRRPWDQRDESQANFQRYVEYMKNQLRELLTNYGEIGILWFDGEWEATWNHEYGKELYNFVRNLQPNIIINNRVDKGREGMGGHTKGEHYGDYGTPEQEIPASGLPGVDWETCMTMNDTWGYVKHDKNWKSAETLLKNLVDIASKGGNYLLNVGPNALGEIPKESVERLKTIGEWLKRNGKAIYGTSGSPFSEKFEWGRITQKPGKLFLHVFDKGRKEVVLPTRDWEIKRVYALGDTKMKPLPCTKTNDGIRISLAPSISDDLVCRLRSRVQRDALTQPSASSLPEKSVNKFFFRNGYPTKNVLR